MFRDARLIFGLVLTATGIGVAAVQVGSLARGWAQADSPRVLIFAAVAICFVCGGGIMAARSLARATPAVSRSRKAWSAVFGLGLAFGAAAVPTIVWGLPVDDIMGGASVLYCVAVMPVVFLLVFGTIVRQGTRPAAPTGRERAPAHRVLLTIVTVLSVCSFAGGLLSLMDRTASTAAPWLTWGFWMLVVGHIGMLAYAVLEWLRPRVGAAVMIAAAIFVAEATIRSAESGSWIDFGLAIVVLAWPMLMLLFGVALLAMGFSRNPLVVIGLVVAAFVAFLILVQVRCTCLVPLFWELLLIYG